MPPDAKGNLHLEEIPAPALAAGSAPLVNTDNAGFVRAGARLGILSVPDADDQSPQAVSYSVNQLLNLVPAGQISFSAIGPLHSMAPPGCTYEATGGAPRTLAEVAVLAGTSADVCAPNWVTTVSGLSETLFGGSNLFVLASIPDLTGGKTIAVKVDGAAVPMVSAGGATASADRRWRPAQVRFAALGAAWSVDRQ